MIAVYMAGDSTMSIKSEQVYPETGWGVPFAAMLSPEVSVENYALNGRSTSSFRQEGSWGKILERLRPDDVVIIQFAHNDEVPEKVGRYTTPDEFRDNLSRYIEETASKGAEPILASPVARRAFADDGTVRDTHPYAALAREVAAATGALFVDLDAITRAQLEMLGEEDSKTLYLHLAPGDYATHPKGREDNTHLSELGAAEVARLFLDELACRGHRLAAYVKYGNGIPAAGNGGNE